MAELSQQNELLVAISAISRESPRDSVTVTSMSHVVLGRDETAHVSANPSQSATLTSQYAATSLIIDANVRGIRVWMADPS
jgi:hypothetical protein